MSVAESIYNVLGRSKWYAPVLLVVLMAALLVPALSLTYSENIIDFLPMDAHSKRGMDIYARISGADKIIVLADGSSREESAAAVDSFASAMAVMDNVDVMTMADPDAVEAMINEIYVCGPALLNDSDIVAAERVLTSRDSIVSRLVDLRHRLLLPGASVSAQDPLGLYSPVLKRALALTPQGNMDIEDGYIFMPDTTTAIAVVTTPYAASETAANARLIARIDSLTSNATVPMSYVGAVPIAVENAAQIKQDTVLSVTIAVVLIALLLFFSFSNRRNLALIPLTLVFAVVFALGIMGMVRSTISLIVIGIAAVIIGIAVNYPLHFVTHADAGHSPQQVLRDIAKPLVVGNITTVAAFLCLLCLEARALQDLGLFAALLLVGSIVFVIIFMPHFINVRPVKAKTVLFGRINIFDICHKRIVIPVMIVITCVLGWFSMDIAFDSDLHNINYITADQRTALKRLEGTNGAASPGGVLAISEATSLDSALAAQERFAALNHTRSITEILPSEKTRSKRIDRWNEAIVGSPVIAETFAAVADSLGFAPSAFDSFYDQLVQRQTVPDNKDLSSIISLLGAQYIINDSSSVTVVAHVNSATVKPVDGVWIFDVNQANSGIATTLTNDFNFVAFACAFIVFAFLWLSFGRIEIAALAFAPMALSWIWILGLMAVFGLKFNIVNIILATFIFGQGDDYTIFITEGVLQQHKTGRRMPRSYLRGIIVSALIMFFGIGSLAFARHPALQSLAWVTILGMSVVVFMACVLPPYLFSLIIKYKRYIPYNKFYDN